MLDKKTKRYIKSKKFQKECIKFNKQFVSLLNKYVDEMPEKTLDNFADLVLPTVLIGHISNFFQHNLEHNEEAVDSFVRSIKATIMTDCNIEEEKFSPYTMIDDIGAVA